MIPVRMSLDGRSFFLLMKGIGLLQDGDLTGEFVILSSSPVFQGIPMEVEGQPPDLLIDKSAQICGLPFSRNQ